MKKKKKNEEKPGKKPEKSRDVFFTGVREPVPKGAMAAASSAPIMGSVL